MKLFKKIILTCISLTMLMGCSNNSESSSSTLGKSNQGAPEDAELLPIEYETKLLSKMNMK